MIKPAIIAVGYNRPDSMKRLLQSVNAAHYPFDDITLIVSIDECVASNEVEEAARSVGWNHGEFKVRRFEERQGLRKHILQCGDLSEEYGAVIILEDDLYVSPAFYQYTYDAVNFYSDDENVAGIALYGHEWNGYANLPFQPMKNEYDVYFAQFSITWGQCWTHNQWKAFKSWYQMNEDKLPEENSKLPTAIMQWSKQSWGKYFVSYIVEKNLYYISPYISLTSNFSDLGQHCTQSGSAYQVPLLVSQNKEYRFPTLENAIKYDVFFERILEGTIIEGIDGKEICVDLNMLRTSTISKRYLLSPEKYPFKVIASYAMAMRPIEANVLFGLEGNEIFLYDCEKENIDLKPNRCNKQRLNYELYSYWWKGLIKTGIQRLIEAIKLRFK